jgi:hypothetical protein
VGNVKYAKEGVIEATFIFIEMFFLSLFIVVRAIDID